MKPTISVIIPSYQHAGTIRACLESVLRQTRSPLEVIVVNDGSTDGTERVLAAYRGRVIELNQPNQGSNAARNNGCALAHGDYVIFCDADVVMQPGMLEKMAAQLDRHPEASYVYSSFRFGWKKFRSFIFSPQRLKEMNYIHTTTLIRRAHFPGFDPSLKRFQDWDVWLTMLDAGHIGLYLDEELFRIVDQHGRKGISQWRPSIIYRIPWTRLGWEPASVRRYEEARRIVRTKHRL